MENINNQPHPDQWYLRNPELFRAEIAQMHARFPDASYGFLKSGKMAWKVTCTFPNFQNEPWTLLLVYDTDCAHGDRAYSIRCYPLSPDYNELTQSVLASDVSPKVVPHCIRDQYGNWCLDVSLTIPRDPLESGKNESAVSVLTDAMDWIAHFIVGLRSPAVWEAFTGRPIRRAPPESQNPCP